MSDIPYRDLGSGFARLLGPEAARRAPSRISTVEDALLVLLQNAADAGAAHVFVSTSLRRRRYRTLTVIDDGEGVPENLADSIFEPGVTSRHLDRHSSPRAGFSLHHVRSSALDARLLSPKEPTAISTTFDTEAIPERSLQSPSRLSRTNLLATTTAFHLDHPHISTYLDTPSRILASLLHNRIILTSHPAELVRGGERLGIRVSARTARRILEGDIRPAGAVRPVSLEGSGSEMGVARVGWEGPLVELGEEEKSAIEDILSRAARARFFEVDEVRFEARYGEIRISARLYEPEEEYD
jgi:hypothetical protein